jgi:hypothetical protein
MVSMDLDLQVQTLPVFTEEDHKKTVNVFMVGEHCSLECFDSGFY